MISLIAAIGKNRELGAKNELPWHLPDDLKNFKRITRGHAVIMGRKTYETIGKPLPERKNIVITRDPAYAAPGCTVVTSLDEAIAAAGNDPEIFVMGGGEIYALALPRADRMYLTFVDAAMQADTFFPDFDPAVWQLVSEEPHAADEKHAYAFVARVYDKKKS
jgi:dihydrofolate reductase